MATRRKDEEGVASEEVTPPLTMAQLRAILEAELRRMRRLESKREWERDRRQRMTPEERAWERERSRAYYHAHLEERRAVNRERARARYRAEGRPERVRRSPEERAERKRAYNRGRRSVLGYEPLPPDQRERKNERMRAYRQRPDVHERDREHLKKRDALRTIENRARRVAAGLVMFGPPKKYAPKGWPVLTPEERGARAREWARRHYYRHRERLAERSRLRYWIGSGAPREVVEFGREYMELRDAVRRPSSRMTR
jgi:hypothetical protein